MEFRDLKKQYQELKPQIDAAMKRVCQTADFISGTEVKELEYMLAEYTGVKHCITCAPGTLAVVTQYLCRISLFLLLARRWLMKGQFLFL